MLRDFDFGIQRQRLRMVRYADDIFIACQSRQECLDAFEVSKELLGKIGHRLPDIGAGKTEMLEPHDSVEFLGYEIAPTKSGAYDILIPEHAFDGLKQRLEIFYDFDRCQSKYRYIENAILSLNNQLSGLSAAYAEAKNIERFRSSLKDKGRNASEAVWSGVFGKTALRKLDPRRRSFLKLD
ncbi:MAG: hypothetical protein AB7E69_11040 [Sphingomonadales bacterium]